MVMLDLRVDRFVTCNVVTRNRDRSVNAVCWVKDRNDALGPDAPSARAIHAWMPGGGPPALR